MVQLYRLFINSTLEGASARSFLRSDKIPSAWLARAAKNSILRDLLELYSWTKNNVLKSYLFHKINPLSRNGGSETQNGLIRITSK